MKKNVTSKFPSRGNVVLDISEIESIKKKLVQKLGFDLPTTTYLPSYDTLKKNIENAVNNYSSKAHFTIGQKFLVAFCNATKGNTFRKCNIDALYLYGWNKLRHEIVDCCENHIFITPQNRVPLRDNIADSTWSLFSYCEKEATIKKSLLKIACSHDEYHRYTTTLELDNSTSENYVGYTQYDSTSSFLIAQLNTESAKSRDLYLMFYVGLDGTPEISVGKLTCFNKSKNTFLSETVVLMPCIKPEESVGEKQNELELEIEDILRKVFSPPHFSVTELLKISNLRELEERLNQKLKKGDRLLGFVGKYKYFMPGRKNTMYDLVYENTLEIKDNGTVSFYNPYTKKRHTGRAFLRLSGTLQIHVFDEDQSTLYQLINVTVNSNGKSVCFLPCISHGFSSEDTAISFKGLLVSDFDITKNHPIVRAFFKDWSYFRLCPSSAVEIEQKMLAYNQRNRLMVQLDFNE